MESPVKQLGNFSRSQVASSLLWSLAFGALYIGLGAFCLSHFPSDFIVSRLSFISVVTLSILHLQLFRGLVSALATLAVMIVMLGIMARSNFLAQVVVFGGYYLGLIVVIEISLRSKPRIHWSLLAGLYSACVFLTTSYFSSQPPGVGKIMSLIIILWILVFAGISFISAPRRLFALVGNYRGPSEISLATAALITVFALLGTVVGIALGASGFQLVDSVLKISHERAIKENSLQKKLIEQNARNIVRATIASARILEISGSIASQRQHPAVTKVQIKYFDGTTTTVFERPGGAASQPPLIDFEPITKARGGPECYAAVSGDSVIFRTEVVGVGDLFSTVSLIELTSSVPGDWVLWNKKEGQKVTGGGIGASIEMDNFWNLDEVLASRRSSPPIASRERSGNYGIKVSSSLNNISSIGISSLVPLDASLNEIESRLTKSAVLAWGFIVLFATASVLLVRLHSRRSSEMLQEIEQWFVDSSAPLTLARTPIIETNEIAQRFERVSAALVRDRRRSDRLSELLKAEHSQLKDIVDALANLFFMFVCDQSGRVVISNESAVRFLDVNVGDTIHSNTITTHRGKLVTEISRVVKESIAVGKNVLTEFHAKDDDTYDMSHNLIYVGNYRKAGSNPNSGSIRSVVVVTDIGELVEARDRAEHQSRLSLLGELVTGMAHELNQPLNTILLAASNCKELLKESDPNLKKASDKIEKIITQVERASLLVRSMKSHGRLATDSVEIVSIEKAVSKAISLVKPQLAIDGIQIGYLTDCDGCMIHANEIIVQQVLGNLLMNAKDAIVENEERLVTETIDICLRCEGRHGIVEVTNSGPDIPSEILSKIFNPFFSTKSTRRGSGVGLGLSLSARQMGDIGGSLQVLSQGGRTTFTVSFLLEASESEGHGSVSGA